MGNEDWKNGSQDLVLAALEWERLRRGMPGSTPETIAAAEKSFWDCATKLQAIKVGMLRAHIQKSRDESPDGMTQWDRVEKFRLEHGHLPGAEEHNCQKCKDGK